MQTIYRNRSADTTVRPWGRRRKGMTDLAALMTVLALALPVPVAAQVEGMVEEPCPAPLPPAPDQPTPEEEVALRQKLAERRRVDWGGLCRHRAANEALRGVAVRVVFIGDSITEFWEGAAPDLFRDGVVNRGIGAQTSPQLLLRSYQDVVSLRPRAVHILVGTNDVAGNTGPSRPEDYMNNIRAMVDLAQAHGATVIIGAIPPTASFYWRPDLRPSPRIVALNVWLRAFAEERGAVFVDYHAAMSGPSGELRPELTEDGVHPNTEGYAIMTGLVRAAVETAAPGFGGDESPSVR